jgi:hypothetical protein
MVGSADGKRTDACYTHVFFLHENYQKAGLSRFLNTLYQMLDD